MNHEEREFTKNLLKIVVFIFLILSVFLLIKFFNTEYVGIIDRTTSKNDFLDQKTFVPIQSNELYDTSLRKFQLTYLIPQTITFSKFESQAKQSFKDHTHLDFKIRSSHHSSSSIPLNYKALDLTIYLSDENNLQLYNLFVALSEILKLQNYKTLFNDNSYDYKSFTSHFKLSLSRQKIEGFEFIQLFRHEEYLYTSGLNFFGLPELFVKSRFKHIRLDELIKQAAHQLIEKSSIDPQGQLVLNLDPNLNYLSRLGKSKVHQTLIHLDQEAIPKFKARSSRIRFFKKKYTQNEAMIFKLDELFGKQAMKQTTFKIDADLQMAVFKTQSKLSSLKKQFQNKSVVYVLAEFATLTSQRNWLWLEVVEWDEKEISGILLDQPSKTFHLRQGSKVKLLQTTVKDYQLYNNNTFISGNLTYDKIAK